MKFPHVTLLPLLWALCLPNSFSQDIPREAWMRESIHSFANERVQSGKLAGVVVEIGNREKVIGTSSAGFADRESKQRIKEDSIFWIASMSKPICGTAVMMAVEKGLLTVSDPVAKHLPEFKNLKGPDGKPASVTIAQCLSHTSGLQDLSQEESTSTTTLAKLTEIVSGKPLNFEPGTKWSYCQTGINTVARILEVVSGETYPAYLRENLFEPLGMDDTNFYLTPEQLDRLSSSYKTTDEGFEKVPIYILGKKSATDTDRLPSAAGGLFSTAADYGKFVRMILNGGEHEGHRFLKPESIAEMTRSHTGDLKAGFVPGSAYGLGWIRVVEPSGSTASLSPGSFGHGGAFGTQAWIDPVKNHYTILMIQCSNLGDRNNSETIRFFHQSAAKRTAHRPQKTTVFSFD